MLACRKSIKSTDLICEACISTKTRKNVFQQKKKKEKNFENLFGKHILGFIAAILVFIGMIAFGALVFAYVTDIIKVIAMFLFSFGITILGVILHKRNASPFTSSVTGCGVGALFVSIFVAHLYFGLINDIVAFVLVLVWAIFVFVIAKHLDSNVLLYIAHIGCLISVLLAIGYGKLEEKLFEIIVYQFLTIVLLFILDFKTSTKLLKMTSIGALLVNGVLSIQCVNLISRSVNSDIFISPSALLLTVFLLTAFACMIYVISSKVYIKNPIVELIFTNFAYLFNLNILIVAILEADVSNVLAWVNISISLLVVASIAGLLSFVKKELATKISLLFSMTYLGFIYLVSALDSSQDMLILPGFVMFILITAMLYNKTKDRAYLIASCSYLCIESFFSLFTLNANCIIWYEIIIIVISFLVAYLYDKNNIMKLSLIPYLTLNSFFTIALFMFVDNMNVADIDFSILCCFLIMTVLNIAFYFTHKLLAKNEEIDKITKIFINVGMHIWAFVNSISIPIMLNGKETNGVFFMLLLLSFVSFFVGMIDVFKMRNSENHMLGVWYGIKFTWLTIFPLTQFTTLLDEQFIFSISCMIVATICILFGFGYKIKSIRVYGLVLILASVVKIVIIDVWSKESIVRVISLLLGGLICFAISALYNRYERKQINLKE